MAGFFYFSNRFWFNLSNAFAGQVEDGANFIFNRITSDCGDTIYSVCASCHNNPSLFVGSTAPRKNERNSFMSLDPTNPKHFAIVLSSPCTPYFTGKNGDLEINAASVETAAGLRKVPRINSESISVRPTKRKKYRRRAGILGEYALRQSHFELKLDEIASIKKTMKMIWIIVLFCSLSITCFVLAAVENTI